MNHMTWLNMQVFLSQVSLFCFLGSPNKSANVHRINAHLELTNTNIVLAFTCLSTISLVHWISPRRKFSTAAYWSCRLSTVTHFSIISGPQGKKCKKVRLSLSSSSLYSSKWANFSATTQLLKSFPSLSPKKEKVFGVFLYQHHFQFTLFNKNFHSHSVNIIHVWSGVPWF